MHQLSYDKYILFSFLGYILMAESSFHLLKTAKLFSKEASRILYAYHQYRQGWRPVVTHRSVSYRARVF